VCDLTEKHGRKKNVEGPQAVLYWLGVTLWAFYVTFCNPFRCP
jgi:hypothetical protein